MKQITLITGASSGIGKELVTIAASEGRNVALIARSENRLVHLKNQLNKKYPEQDFIVQIADLSKPGVAEKVYKNVSRRYEVDVLINNAGFGDLSALVDADKNKLEKMIHLNCSSLTTLSKLAAEDMSQNGGHILNVASIAAFMPGPYMATYYATKAYVLSFSEAIAEELKGRGVVVSALCPGPTQSEFASRAATDGEGLFSNQNKLPTALEVAGYGWSSLFSKKVVAVHGNSNKLYVFLKRILPRRLIAKLIARAQR